MLRSIEVGTIRVHQRLNAGRAITLCWTANTSSRATSTTSETASGSPAAPAARPRSIDFGTTRFPTKPIA